MNNPMFTMPGNMPMQFPMMPQSPYPTYPPPTPYQTSSVPQTQPSGMEWVWADTLADADRVYVAPGKTVYVMVRNAPVFVERSANASGNAVSSKAYQFSALEPAQEASPSPEYAPLATVQRMQSQIADLADEINALKGGASRGKSVKQPANAE